MLNLGLFFLRNKLFGWFVILSPAIGVSVSGVSLFSWLGVVLTIIQVFLLFCSFFGYCLTRVYKG